MTQQPINVLLAGSELTPLAKAGGLGDVLGSLPKALQKNVNKSWVAIPWYQEIRRKQLRQLKKLGVISITVGGSKTKITVWESRLPNSTVPLLLFENKKYFGRGTIYQGNTVYDPLTKKNATSKIGQRIRFMAFSFAVYTAIKEFSLPISVIHAQDYHSAPLLALVHNDPEMAHIKRVITLHNLGIVAATPHKYLEAFEWDAKKIFGSEFNRKKGPRLIRLGIDHAQAIVAVSPRYAKEVLTKEYGNGLESVLKKRKKDLYGVLNGIDTELFNPSKDAFIKKNYTVSTVRKNKAINKLALQKEVGLPQRKDVPMFSLVSRLTSQKGLDLLTPLLPKLAQLDIQFVLEGTGPSSLTAPFHAAQKQWPDKFYFHNIFNAPFAQRIYASSDIFLMPSKFEPCGLGQIIAMRYGTVPIARATGGLKNTVFEKTNGFVFTTYSSAALWRTIQRSLAAYAVPKTWGRLQRNGMKTDFSWKTSAGEYIKIYNNLLQNTHG